ncbi:efflux RND transporter periplasmic adaptor subunit [Microbulbifer elongatus]|uniref:efflux RND transporter periplasmic adaptor subunit n=1 Tax=Microbulbifer elongatus TaxID=86173 RepID=UPI001CFC8489|nr:HlyD family efflux transporter periplasmic adaptor subunit [Microbulbifer elongatus]
MSGSAYSANAEASDEVAEEVEQEVGPNHGRMLRSGDFAVELAIVESGTPPEFRAWVTDKGKPVAPQKVGLTLMLTRLGNVREPVGFTAGEEYLRSAETIGEPHSFIVTVNAQYQGQRYEWKYETFEGRSQIEAAIAKSMGIKTAIVGPAVLSEVIRVYGKVVMNPEQTREVRARFDGTVESVKVGLGERVAKGQPVLAINSNENLKTYTVYAPIDGVVLQRNANPGEQSGGRDLLVIANDTALLAELDVFPSTRSRIQVGNPVKLMVRGLRTPIEGVVQQVSPVIQANQSTTVRVSLKGGAKSLAPGRFVTGEIQVASYKVPLAVKRRAIQTFRDFDVVYQQAGDVYEVRMLDLGRESGDWVEVLGGIEAGARYVVENSYIIKADIEKSGAAHEH